MTVRCIILNMIAGGWAAGGRAGRRLAGVQLAAGASRQSVGMQRKPEGGGGRYTVLIDGGAEPPAYAICDI